MTRRIVARPLLVLAGALALGLAVGACDLSALDTPSPRPSIAAATPTPVPSFVRPTPTPRPTFLVYVVAPGDTLSSIARGYGTKAQSIAYWNRAAYPTLDPESARYDPNKIKVGWALLLIPNGEVDPEDLPPPAATPTPSQMPGASESPA